MFFFMRVEHQDTNNSFYACTATSQAYLPELAEGLRSRVTSPLAYSTYLKVILWVGLPLLPHLDEREM